MRHLLIALALLIATPAASWEVTRTKDPMTDRTVTWASARDGDATLLVGCLNGQVQPRVTWGRRIGYGDVGATYRMDDGPVTPRMAMLSQTGDALYLWAPGDVARMRAGRRVRVSIGGKVYDFDTIKGEPLPAKGWGC